MGISVMLLLSALGIVFLPKLKMQADKEWMSDLLTNGISDSISFIRGSILDLERQIKYRRTIRWTEAGDRPLPDGTFSCPRSVIGVVRHRIRSQLHELRHRTLRQDVLKKAIDDDLGDYTVAPALSTTTLASIKDRLSSLGYAIESENPNCTEFIHPNAAWALQVAVFKTEIAFSVPYWMMLTTRLPRRRFMPDSWLKNSTLDSPINRTARRNIDSAHREQRPNQAMHPSRVIGRSDN